MDRSRNMIRRFAFLLGLTALMPSLGHAQTASITPLENQLYCSGIVTPDPVPTGTYVITGEESYFHIIYSDGKLVFLNKGASQGVKVGDQFEVVRPVTADVVPYEWFKSQNLLLKAMGTTYEDEARLTVV